MAFCDDCGKAIEWHKTAQGKSIAMDPDPVADGKFAFDVRARVVQALSTSRKRYACHFDTCAKRGQGPRRAASSCDREDCTIATPHRHCFTCGGTDHLADDCPED
jgi:hypothetical protein